ncbi:MAG: flippase [Balneolales bacterium]|nr:flippase [Balneolales bacterium]
MSNQSTKSEIGISVAQNMSVMFGAQIVTWGTSFALLYFLPRYLGPEDFGRLYLALSIKMILGLFIDFGGNYLIPKEVALSHQKGEQILSSYLLIRVALWVLSIGLILLFSNLLGYSQHVHILILILIVAKLWEGGTTALNAYFEGIEKMEYPSIGKIVEKVFVAVFAIIALLLGADSIGVAVVMTLGALVNLVVIYIFSRRVIRIQYKFDPKFFSLFRSGMPFFLFSLFSVIYYRIDAVMLASLTTEEVTGWYGGAFRFFDIIMVLPLLYKTAIFPVFSKLWDNTKGVLESTVGHSIRLMIILGIPTATLIFIFSESIIQFFMGTEAYGPSIIILKIFALSIPFIYIDIILGSALMGAANKQKAWAIIGLIAIIVNVSANYILIPYTQLLYLNGGIGAAVATLITEIFVMILAIYLVPKTYLQTFRSSYILKPLFATILMVVPVFLLLTFTNIYWLIVLFLASVIYVFLLFMLKTFDKVELRMITTFISQSRQNLLTHIKFI